MYVLTVKGGGGAGPWFVSCTIFLQSDFSEKRNSSPTLYISDYNADYFLMPAATASPSPPVILPAHSPNVSVSVGERGVLGCRVRHASMNTVSWVHSLEEGAAPELLAVGREELVKIYKIFSFDVFFIHKHWALSLRKKRDWKDKSPNYKNLQKLYTIIN